jgi:uncharacterized protein (DUF4415 family)
MKRKQQVTKTTSSRLRRRRAAQTGRRRKGINTRGLAERKKLVVGALHAMKITDFYKPLKKPITVRLDADVLAWFKKDGRRYQSRINAALRKVMEREMRATG